MNDRLSSSQSIRAKRGWVTPSTVIVSKNIANGRTHSAASPRSGRYKTNGARVSLCLTTPTNS